MMNHQIQASHIVFIKPKHLFWFPVICIALLLGGCKKDPKVAFIQGIWYYHDTHLANIPGEDAQETSWEFVNGYVSMRSCCFVKISFSGYYSISDRSENELTLDLFNLEGQYGGTALHRDDTLTAVIRIDTSTDTIKINNSGPYTRQSP